MADRTCLFEELLTEPNLRSKVYELEERPDVRLVCVEMTGRRGPDWFFARRWVSVRGSRRLLYRLVDDCERHGFRFAVGTDPGVDGKGPLREVSAQAQSARNFVEELDPEERTLYQELFPEETRLLAMGYDWDHATVSRDGETLAVDAAGRILERADGVLWEWVRVDEEFTWRRYPLERLRMPETEAQRPSAAVGTA